MKRAQLLVEEFIATPRRLFINGQWADAASGKTFATPNPATGQTLSQVAEGVRYTDTDDAIRIANDTDYGLGGSVWTSDPDRGMAVARRVRTGTIGINGYLPDPGAPFGGVKASGIGRELGPNAIASYQQLKSIYT